MEVLAQSRSTVLSTEHDNAGFHAWVRKHEDDWRTVNWWNLRNLAKDHAKGCLQSVCFFGEFAGPGIQKGTALNSLEHKIFAVFGLMLIAEGEELPLFFGNPIDITNHLPKVPDTYVLPWHGPEIEVDYARTVDELQVTADVLSKAVDEVEACDPWVKKDFGVKGIGEGLVYYPVSKVHLGHTSFSNLCFKAKGEKHKVVKQKQAVQVSPETAASITEFVDMVVTEARLEQGVADVCGGEYDTKKIGPFIGWLTKDVNKECQAELEASGLSWKQVSKAVAAKARTWYMYKVETT